MDEATVEQIYNQACSLRNITPDSLFSLCQSYESLTSLVVTQDLENKFSKPMPWIGIYIVVASLICILAMAADLFHGLRNYKLWFPCKYLTLNAASLTVIGIAMKLPMDLNNPMPGFDDQASKIGSMAFMCTFMANTLPSQAKMSEKELVSNIIALNILVITMVVDVFIQIKTGVISNNHTRFYPITHVVVLSGNWYRLAKKNLFSLMAAFYVAMLLPLLMIYTCSSVAILRSKQVLESKYHQIHVTTLLDHQQGRSSVEKLKQHVINYSIMTGTGNPQFLSASSATTSASGVICALSAIIHILIMRLTFPGLISGIASDYKWTTVAIFITQSIGVILGTIAPIARCFTSLSFNLSIKWIGSHITKVFKVESYWTHRLSDWKQTSISSPFRSRKCRIVIENLKILILSICIGFQKTVVVACKMIALIPILIVTFVLAMFSALSIVLGKKHEQQEPNMDIHRYALQIQEEMNFSQRTLKGISKSAIRLIEKAEKRQPKNLMKLIAESRGFEGVGKYDSHLVPSLHSVEHLDCWSLPLVTLTTITISLPNIQTNLVDRLMRSVGEGLVYATLVEESLYVAHNYVSVLKATKILWLHVEVHNEWCGKSLKKLAPQLNTAQKIVKWFKDTATTIVSEVESQDIGTQSDDDIYRSIFANSMYRITETILLAYDNSIDEVSQEELFEYLSSMIADILAACLTNLPRVIVMKCHTSVVENREASVHVAAQLLGETMQIINRLKDHELPNLNPDDLAFIDKWRAYLQHPHP